MKHLKLYESVVKMPSIFKKQVVYSVNCSDLSSFIIKIYGRDPEIEACLELGDDSTFEIEASASEFVNSDQEDEFAQWLKKPKWYRSEIYMLMNKLSLDGHIVDGNYLIKTY